jgi:signal recognition particle subunit SRP54
MFGNLSDRLQDVFEKLRRQKTLTDDNIGEALREVKMALLEADVNIAIVKDFVSCIRSELVGRKIDARLDPRQEFVRLVHEKLVEIMGGTSEESEFRKGRLQRIMLVGLQGSGKTTTAGKLALKYKDFSPLLVACDVYRPAAIRQLETVSSKAGAAFFEQGTDNPVQIAESGLKKAASDNHSLVIFDTAGRLQIDEDLMQELENMKSAIKPDEILLVIDSMTGQEAVKVAMAFDQRLSITGVILSKTDGDARGGAALSIRKTVGKPIRYIGVGEKLDGLEVFDPERMASRILGMGDIVGLAEKASSVIEEKDAKRMQRKMLSGEFNLVDFLSQLELMNKLGPLEDIMRMMPGMGRVDLPLDGVEKQMGKTVAIIRSMTPGERLKPDVLNASRKKRIAKGSGTDVQEINNLLRQFEQMKSMMKQLKKMGLFKPSNLAKGKLPFGF